MAARPAPAVHRIQAPAAWRAIDFISDLHLTEAMPRTFSAFEAHLRASDADAIFVLGDLFELWVGDDACTQPFAARCVSALHAAAARCTLGIMVGNRDFLIGSGLLAACGAMPLPDPTRLEAFGSSALLSHGDALCIGDVEYQQFRAQVRSPGWQREFLERPLEERLALARRIREASQAQQVKRQFDGTGYADADAELAARWLNAARTRTLVHGHTHRPGSEAWPGGLTRHVLTDWDLDQGQRAEVLRLSERGFERIAPMSP
jgi:UDP-2,3-diacylglucosamine hydrolase